jgi:hypothetical protein
MMMREQLPKNIETGGECPFGCGAVSTTIIRTDKEGSVDET